MEKKQVNAVLANFFSTTWRLRLILTLREKKICFEQLLHITSLLCGKAVDWIFRLTSELRQNFERWVSFFRPGLSERLFGKRALLSTDH
jgi:hypothetical protein